ncbi:MAG: hypothetical protein IPK65_01065 [Gammaproteobacteria bacterium]|nr:hypothetical protein [Gammaproteobacteria bacterium]
MLTVAYANDESINAGEEGKNSVMALLNAMPMEGLNLELGLLTQEDDPDHHPGSSG